MVVIFVIIVFVIVIAIIISSFSMLLTFIFLVFTILFYLCIYRIFLNFNQMTYQCLWWELWTLFAYFILPTISFFEIDQLSMKLSVWFRSVDSRIGFSLQGFCILYFILSKFLAKDVLRCIVNPTYWIECCDCTFINLGLKTIVLIFNTTHKMGCCKYCYWLGWYNIRRVKSGSLNYPFLG